MYDVRDASLRAIHYVIEMEHPNGESPRADYRESARVAIEDARHDTESGTWTIGVGFIRPWDRDTRLGALAPLLLDAPAAERRTVKHVRLDDETGRLIAYY